MQFSASGCNIMDLRKISHAELLAWRLMAEKLTPQQLVILHRQFCKDLEKDTIIAQIFLHYSSLLLSKLHPVAFNNQWSLVVKCLENNLSFNPNEYWHSPSTTHNFGFASLPQTLRQSIACYLDSSNYLKFAMLSRQTYTAVMKTIHLKSVSFNCLPIAIHRFAKVICLTMETNKLVSCFRRSPWEIQYNNAFLAKKKIL